MSRTRNLVSVSQYPADRACARISAQGHSQGISSSALPVPLLPADEGRRRGEAAPPVAGVGLGERREATRLRFSELRAASPLQFIELNSVTRPSITMVLAWATPVDQHRRPGAHERIHPACPFTGCRPVGDQPDIDAALRSADKGLEYARAGRQ